MVRLLARADHDVVVYDNLSAGHRSAVTAGEFVEGELSDQAKLTELMRSQGIEAVIHFAAFALVGESVVEPAKYYENNVVATFRLLEAMRDAGVKRIVFSSTCATYGVPSEIPISEKENQSPVNPYGFSKLVIEHMMSDYAHAYGLGFAALRYFNAAGASPEGDIGEDHDPESHLIPICLQVALGQRKHLTVYGSDYPTPDGTCIRDYIHVDDLGAAHLAALEKLTDGSQIKLNLGTGKGMSVQEVLESCRRVTGHDIPVEMGTRRPGDPPELVADASSARVQLGWEAKYTDLDQIVETAWNWHRNHPHGYGDG